MLTLLHNNRLLSIDKPRDLLPGQQLAAELLLSSQIKPIERQPDPKHGSGLKFYSGCHYKQTIHLGYELIVPVL